MFVAKAVVVAGEGSITFVPPGYIGVAVRPVVCKREAKANSIAAPALPCPAVYNTWLHLHSLRPHRETCLESICACFLQSAVSLLGWLRGVAYPRREGSVHAI